MFTKIPGSVQFSHSVMSDSLWPHESQHARPPCPSPTPRVHPNSCPLSWWCHPTISSSLVPFSSCPQSFPASGSFPMSQLFSSGGHSIGVSVQSVPPMNTQDWYPLGWTSWISLQSKGLSGVFSNTRVHCTRLASASKAPGVNWGGKVHNLKVENYVLFGWLSEDLSPGGSLSKMALKDCSREVREEPGYTGVFATKTS